MTVADHAPGRQLLRKELAQFVFKPGARGQLRLEAARGHDDLVIAAALAVLAVDLAALVRDYPARPCRRERQAAKQRERESFFRARPLVP